MFTFQELGAREWIWSSYLCDPCPFSFRIRQLEYWESLFGTWKKKYKRSSKTCGGWVPRSPADSWLSAFLLIFGNSASGCSSPSYLFLEWWDKKYERWPKKATSVWKNGLGHFSEILVRWCLQLKSLTLIEHASVPKHPYHVGQLESLTPLVYASVQEHPCYVWHCYPNTQRMSLPCAPFGWCLSYGFPRMPNHGIWFYLDADIFQIWAKGHRTFSSL